MAIAIQELKNLNAADVAAKLGGIKEGGATGWRIPDLCEGETRIGNNPPFSVWMEGGAMHWWCHKHNDAETSTAALSKALFGYYQDGFVTEAFPSMAAPKMPDMQTPKESYKTISVR